MNKNNLKNRIFKSTMKIIGNKGLANNSLGNSIKKILVKSSKSNEAIVNGCKMQLDENDIMQISNKGKLKKKGSPPNLNIGNFPNRGEVSFQDHISA